MSSMMFDKKTDEEKKRDAKRKLKIIPVLLLIMITGAVALVQLSEFLAAQFQVQTDVPLDISWNPSPSDDYVELHEVCIGGIEYINTVGYGFTSLRAIAALTCPSMISNLDDCLNMTMDDKMFANWTGSAGSFSGYVELDDITAYETGLWSFTFEITSSTNTTGTWNVNIYIIGDPA